MPNKRNRGKSGLAPHQRPARPDSPAVAGSDRAPQPGGQRPPITGAAARPDARARASSPGKPVAPGTRKAVSAGGRPAPIPGTRRPATVPGRPAAVPGRPAAIAGRPGAKSAKPVPVAGRPAPAPPRPRPSVRPAQRAGLRAPANLEQGAAARSTGQARLIPTNPSRTPAAAASPVPTAVPAWQVRAGDCPETPLRVIPLGGMREIGKNMTVYEYGDDMIVIDCGLAFPEEDMPGIDIVIPDFSYVLENRHKLRGVFLTHGHEDHIGALPWLCRDIGVPIYANSLTIALVRLKLADRSVGGCEGMELIEVKPGERVAAGRFEVEFIHMNHSIADANSFAIRTPAGTVFHSGDFKIDYTPVNGVPMDLSRIAAIGAEGVLLMMCESTNVERPGYTPSESTVGASFADIFARAPGRIIVATFSSNVFRLQSIISAAENQNRKVALIGRSMLNVFGAASELGYIHMKPDTLIDVSDLDRYPDREIVLISTGSQGEPMSALTRMAFAEHRMVEIRANDTVVISASPIPGNEKPIHRVINELFKRGARVIYEALADIHVSGHAYQEELKLLHSLIRPKFFLPGHGEYRHLYRHGELASELGLSWDNITLLNNGDIFEVCGDRAGVVGVINAAGVLIDGSGRGDIDNRVLRDRRLLAEDGVVTVFIAVNGERGELAGPPDIQARGFIYESEATQILEECRRKITAFVRKAEREGKPLAALLRGNTLRDQLRDLLFERTRRKPVILISVLET